MAEQKNEDTKPAAARRAVRPFVGPAGASPGSRPLLRPPAPNDRPRPAAFAPPVPPERPSLGTAPDRAAAVAVDAAPVPAPLDAPRVAHDSPPAAAIAESTLAPTFAAPAKDLTVPVASNPTAERDSIATSRTPIASPTVRPMTSETVAIDAFDAFESVWDASTTDHIAPAPDGVVASPLDELSLGGGLDGPHRWTEEITAAPEQAVDAPAAPASPGDESVVAPSWPEPAAGEIAMPPWLADDPEPVVAAPTASDSMQPTHLETSNALELPAAADSETMAPDADAGVVDDENAQWPDPLLAEYAPYIPTPSSISAIAHVASPTASTDDESVAAHGTVEPSLDRPEAFAAQADPAGSEINVVAQTGEVEAGGVEAAGMEAAEPAAEVVPAAGIRVSAALDRLADRVRSGEIDVSSVAAEASDAAVLASVLAALLGGSSSR